MLLNKLTNIKHDKLNCVLFSNALFQSPVFLKYHQIFFKKLPYHRFIHIVNVYAATCHVHLCVWSVLLRINKSPLVYFFFSFYVLFLSSSCREVKALWQNSSDSNTKPCPSLVPQLSLTPVRYLYRKTIHQPFHQQLYITGGKWSSYLFNLD